MTAFRSVAPRMVAVSIAAMSAVTAEILLTGCSDSSAIGVQSHQVAGAAVRVSVGGSTYDLDIEEMAPQSDGGANPPSCVTRVSGTQYDLNWSPVRSGNSTSRAARVSIRTADGTPLTVNTTQGSCTALRDYPFALISTGYQLVLAASVRGAHQDRLTVSVDGVSRVVTLRPTCTQADYEAQSQPPCADDPPQFGSPGQYIVRIRA